MLENGFEQPTGYMYRGQGSIAEKNMMHIHYYKQSYKTFLIVFLYFFVHKLKQETSFSILRASVFLWRLVNLSSYQSCGILAASRTFMERMLSTDICQQQLPQLLPWWFWAGRNCFCAKFSHWSANIFTTTACEILAASTSACRTEILCYWCCLC